MVTRWMDFSRTRNRIRSVWRGRGFIAEACVRLVFVRLALLLFPLKRQAKLHSPSKDVLSRQVGQATEDERQQVRAIGWAVTKAAAHLPIGARCLAQALTARAMLRRRGIGSIMRIGVSRPDANSLKAHAWLEAKGVEVTGYPVPPHLHEISILHSEGAKRS